jgi:hypothetical protein
LGAARGLELGRFEYLTGHSDRASPAGRVDAGTGMNSAVGARRALLGLGRASGAVASEARSDERTET